MIKFTWHEDFKKLNGAERAAVEREVRRVAIERPLEGTHRVYLVVRSNGHAYKRFRTGLGWVPHVMLRHEHSLDAPTEHEVGECEIRNLHVHCRACTHPILDHVQHTWNGEQSVVAYGNCNECGCQRYVGCV